MKNIIKDPLNISIAWWGIWGAISSFSLTGITTPSNYTYFILSLFLIGLFIGGFLIRFITLKDPKNNFAEIEKCYNTLFKISSYVLFLVLSILVVKCTILILQNAEFDYTEGYKAIAFSTTKQVGRLFNSKTLENLYFFLSSPLLYFVGIYGLVDFLKHSRFKKLILAFVLNGMDAYIRLARINVYMMLLLFALVLLISDHQLLALVKNKKKEFMLIFLSFLSLLIIGFSRGYSPKQQLKMFAIDYHTVGFSLFDYELKNPTSPLNSNLTWGRLSLGGLETCFTIVIRQFDKSYHSPALSNAIRMAENDVLIGKIRYNSFYTLLYTFYSDGRLVGVLAGGLIFGFSLKYYYKRWKKFNTSRDSFYVILIFSTIIMSIFISQLEIMRTWMIYITLILIEFFTRKTKNI